MFLHYPYTFFTPIALPTCKLSVDIRFMTVYYSHNVLHRVYCTLVPPGLIDPCWPQPTKFIVRQKEEKTDADVVNVYDGCNYTEIACVDMWYCTYLGLPVQTPVHQCHTCTDSHTHTQPRTHARTHTHTCLPGLTRLLSVPLQRGNLFGELLHLLLKSHREESTLLFSIGTCQARQRYNLRL